MINQNVKNEKDWIDEGISKNTKYNTRTGNKCTNTFAFAYHAVNKKILVFYMRNIKISSHMKLYWN